LQNRFTENSESADYDGGKNILKGKAFIAMLTDGRYFS